MVPGGGDFLQEVPPPGPPPPKTIDMWRLLLVAACHSGVGRNIFIVLCALEEHGGWYQYVWEGLKRARLTRRPRTGTFHFRQSGRR
jgi:hypothetical protein